MPTGSWEPEASNCTVSPGSAGLGVAVKLATGCAAQLASEMSRPQFSSVPTLPELMSWTSSFQVPCSWTPIIFDRSPSAMYVPVNGPVVDDENGAPWSAVITVLTKFPEAPPR